MSTEKEDLCAIGQPFDVTVRYNQEIIDIVTTHRITCKNSYLTGEAFAAEDEGISIDEVRVVTTQKLISFDELKRWLEERHLAYGCIRVLLGYILANKNPLTERIFAPGQTLTVAGFIGVPFFSPDEKPTIDLDFPTERAKRLWPAGTALIAKKNPCR